MCSRKWLILVLVACGLSSACSQYNTNLSIQTSSSILSFVSPSSATVGAQGFTITANGSGFVAGALILWNGTALNTTLVSSIQLTAPVPASYLTAPGTVKIAVQIPGSAQSATQNVNNTTTTEISDQVLFTIGSAPGTPPTITSLSTSTTSAASTPYCSTQGFTVTVDGTNFTSDAVVNWNGVELVEPNSVGQLVSATTFVSATQLTALVPAADAVFPGAASITVSNSLGISNSLPVTLITPVPALTSPSLASVSPNTIGAGSPPLNITVQGGVLPCTLIQWVNSNNSVTTLPTTYFPAVAATQTLPATPAYLVATVPIADLATSGAANVQLVNPGSSASSRLPFTIGLPTVSSLSSSTTSSNTTPACSPSGFTLTVNGNNFVNGSVVYWNIQPSPAIPSVLSARATTFVSSTQLTAVISAADIASAGNSSESVNVGVSNSGILSNVLPFSISSAVLLVPTLTSISPSTMTAGTASFTLIVNDKNILPCTVVQWVNGATTTQLTTTYVAATPSNPAELTATVPTAEFAAVGTADVNLFIPPANPCPPPGLVCGGGTSTNQIAFSIVAPTITALSSSAPASPSSPNTTTACSATGSTLTVTGTNFVPNGLVVNWNGSPRPTTYVSPTQLIAAISPADTAFQGTVAITVSSSTITSNSLPFSVNALTKGTTLPTPVISSISPTSAATEAQTGPPIALTVNGNKLLPCTVAQWNGNPLPTTIFVGTGGVASFIPAANLSTIGTNQVSATTPGPAASNNEPFTIYTPGSPAITSVPGGSLTLPVLSANQRFSVFVLASVDGKTETPGTTQNIFLNDTCFGVTSGCTASIALVSAAANSTPPTPGNADSISPSISANGAPLSPDGRYVAFLSSATNLVTPATNGLMQAFVRDTCAGVASGCTPSTQIVSVTSGTPAVQANAPALSATIDATGRYVTFESSATNLGSTSSSSIGLFVRDTCTGAPSGCTPTTQPLN